ncbi:MAG: hypothetical protein ACKOPT_18150 [Cyanobium sp.]
MKLGTQGLDAGGHDVDIEPVISHNKICDLIERGATSPKPVSQVGVGEGVAVRAAAEHIHLQSPSDPASMDAISEGRTCDGVSAIGGIDEEIGSDQGDSGEIKGVGLPVSEEANKSCN